MTSCLSYQLQEEEVADFEFEEAPYDIYEEHVSVGRIIVAIEDLG